MRQSSVVFVILAVALTSCATIPAPQDANDVVLMLREYDDWAWAVGIVLIWADVVLPVPQTVVIAALGVIYGAVLGALLGTIGLITGGLFGYGLMLTSARRMASCRPRKHSAATAAAVRSHRSRASSSALPDARSSSKHRVHPA